MEQNNQNLPETTSSLPSLPEALTTDGEITLTPEEIAQMDSETRVAIIMRIRQKKMGGDDLTDEEVKTGVRLIRAERVLQAESVNKKTAKKQAEAFSLEDF